MSQTLWNKLYGSQSITIKTLALLPYFFIFALTPPRTISVFLILTGTLLTIIAGFLLGQRPETPLIPKDEARI